MSVGSLEEIIDDNHAIVSTSVGSEHYVSILSFVDKDQLEPGPYFKMTCEVPLADWKELARLEIILTSHFE
jgi:ATP-dependent 26S proteasome regulatory subunit